MRLVRSCPGQRDDHKLIAARCQGKEKRRREKGRVITNHMLSSVIFLIASFACSLLLRPFQACDSKMKIAKPRKEKGEEGKRQIQCVVVRLTCVLPCPCRLLALSASKITIDRTVERREGRRHHEGREYKGRKGAGAGAPAVNLSFSFRTPLIL